MTKSQFEFKQGRRRGQRERHLKVELRVSVIICQLFQVIRPPKCVLCILKLNWNHWRLQEETKICRHVLTSSIYLHNMFFSFKERWERQRNIQKWKVHVKSVQTIRFIVKYTNLWQSCCRRGRKLAFIRWIAVLSWFVKGHSPSFITSMDKSEKKHTQKSTHLLR